MCGVCSGLAVKILEPRYWHGASAFIVGFRHGWCLVLVFLLLILGKRQLDISNFNDNISFN